MATDGLNPIADANPPATTASLVRSLSGKRRKIEIRRIEAQSSLFVAFSKRRNGLFGKLEQFCNLSPGTQAAMVTFSPSADKTHACGSPSVEPILRRFLEQVGAEGLAPSSSSGSWEKEKGTTERKTLSGKAEERYKRDGFWWEKSIEGMGMEELEALEAALLELRRNLEMKISEDKIREVRTKIFFF